MQARDGLAGADTFCRCTVLWFGQELPVGVITACCGGPFFLVLLRRRGTTIIPFVGLALTVSVSAVYAYGGNRFRTPLDMAVVVLSAVTLAAVVEKVRARRHVPPPEGAVA